MKRITFLLGILLALASGCQKEEATSDEPKLVSAPLTQPAPSVPPPPTGSTPSPGGLGATSGTVVETMNSGGYTYARLDLGDKELWAAGPETSLSVGAKVSFASGAPMPGFHSSTLNRTFEMIYFVPALLAGDGAGSAAPVEPGVASPGHGRNAAVPSTSVDKLAVAPGGHTIDAIYGQSKALAGKEVVVRGRVVKFNAGILGRNWIHIQDGSGGAGTSDLTVTTSGTAAIGDVVVVRGALALDKNFGAGYEYPLIVEDASVTVE